MEDDKQLFRHGILVALLTIDAVIVSLSIEITPILHLSLSVSLGFTMVIIISESQWHLLRTSISRYSSSAWSSKISRMNEDLY